jgi:hypothetical protein
MDHGIIRLPVPNRYGDFSLGYGFLEKRFPVIFLGQTQPGFKRLMMMLGSLLGTTHRHDRIPLRRIQPAIVIQILENF